MNFTTPPPEGILDPKIPWSRINPNSRLWLILKARLTGKPQADGYYYSSYVNLSNEEADRLIANMKKDPMGYPSLDQESGTPPEWMERQEKYQKWLVERYLKNESAFTESFVDTTKPVEEKVEEEAQEVVEEVEEEVKDNLEEASKEVEEKIEEEQQAPDLSDLPVNVQQSLIDLINKRTGSNLPKPEKEKSSGVTNTTILRTLTASLQKIQGQLASIDNEIKKQNQMIGAALGTVVSNLNQIETSYEGLNDKFDALLAAFDAQTQLQKDAADQAETDAAIAQQKQQSDTASTFGFKDTTGKGGGLLGALTRFFGKKLGRFLARSLFKLLPKKARFALLRKFVQAKRLRGLAKNLGGKAFRYGMVSLARGTLRPQLGNIRRMAPTDRLARGAQKIVKRRNLNIADKGERLASMAFKPSQELSEIAAEKGAQKLTAGGGMNIFQRALKSKAVQTALVKKLGKEGAEKLTVKIAAKLVPGVSTAYGLGEGIARIAMGDVKGGFLSFGSAIPVAGYGFTAIDILRDIDTNAYTKHIESNLPAPSGANFGAFFSEALGVTEDQYETGSDSTKPGLAMMHGTEAIIPKDQYSPAILSPVAGALVAASSNFLTQAGPAASLVAPTFKQVVGSLSNSFDIPTTLAQTNVGGSFAGIDTTLKDTKQKVREDGYEGEDAVEMDEKDKKIFNEANKETGGFFDKLRRFFGITYKGDKTTERPSGEYSDDPTDPGDGTLRFGLTGRTAMGVGGWSHAHFEAQDGSTNTLVKDVVPLVKKMANMGLKPELSDGTPIPKDATNAELDKLIRKGQARHTHSGPKAAVDINMPGFPKVPFKLTDVRNTPSKGEGVNALVPGTGKTALYHLSYKANGYKDGGDTPSTTSMIQVGEVGREKVMKNLVVSHKTIDKHLDALNAASTSNELINTYKTYAPEVLMYDEEAENESSAISIVNITQPSSGMAMNAGSKIDPYTKRSEPSENSSKTLMMQKLLV